MKLKMKHWPLLASLVWAMPAMATDLGTISVTADRSGTPVSEASRAVTVIDRQTIEASHAQNVVDLFKGMPDITVRDTTGIGAKSQVDLGGFGEAAAANSLVLIDGRRVNSPDLSGVDWTQIPVDQIERIEIVHGGGSVLYGQGAVGGIINIITRIPESGGRISVDAGSLNTQNGGARFGMDTGAARFEINASGQHTDGYRVNSRFDRSDIGVRGEADLPANFSVYLRGNSHQDKMGMPGALTTAQLAADRRQSLSPNDFSRTRDRYVDGGVMWSGAGGIELDLGGGLRKRSTHAEYVAYNSISDFGLLDRSFRPKLTWNAGDSLHTKVVVGADIDRGKGSYAFSGAFPLPTTTFKRQRDGYYAFADLGAGNGRWHINGGARSEKLTDSFSQGGLSSVGQRKGVWEAGASVAVLDGLTLHLNAATSVRFPLLDERFSFFTGSVNTALLAQTGQHFAASLRYELSDGFAEFAFSRADLKNEIYYDPLTATNSNYTGKTRHDVLMVQEQWQLTDQARLTANYTFTSAKFRGGSYAGKEIPAVPKHKVGARIDADFHNGFGMMFNLNWLSSSWLISDQANARPKLPAYLVMDAGLNYRWKKAEFFVTLNNLTSRKYSSYGVYYPGFPPFVPATDNYYPAATFTARAGVSYSF